MSYVDKELKWLNVISNEQYTYYHVHNKREIEAINDIDILF